MLFVFAAASLIAVPAPPLSRPSEAWSCQSGSVRITGTDVLTYDLRSRLAALLDAFKWRARARGNVFPESFLDSGLCLNLRRLERDGKLRRRLAADRLTIRDYVIGGAALLTYRWDASAESYNKIRAASHIGPAVEANRRLVAERRTELDEFERELEVPSP